MSRMAEKHSPARLTLVRLTARIGALSAEALAEHEGDSPASARARLLAAERVGLLVRARPLTDQPALFTLTRAGLSAVGMRGVDTSRISAANARHAAVCARVAVALERAYPDRRVTGEHELRRAERERGAPLASARLGRNPDGTALLHRPDLVLWPHPPEDLLPVAVEVELTVKAPRRLAEICSAWARCRCVEGVLYLAAEEADHALQRAVEKANAHSRVVIAPLSSLYAEPAQADERTVPSRA
jgi:hypothetical protein